MSLVDDIKAHVRISELAVRYTEVRRRGRLHVCRCLCGQNSDRNPSFTLYDDDNHFHCFACGRHGSVFDLVMLTEGIDFKAALERLRSSVLPGHDDGRPRRVNYPEPPSRSNDITDEARAVLEAATAHYQAVLQRRSIAQTYLRKRGLNDDTMAKLRIGYAGGDLGRALFEYGVDLSLAAQIGLLTPRGELMRGRIVFPVMDAQGRPVWMIGRALDGATQPKYLGLPDDAVHKLPLVLGTPKRGVIWVEGAFDIAALVQWGLDVDYLLIALLGTAHLQTMAMLRDRVAATSHIIALDQDDAGEWAAQAMMVQMRAKLSTNQIVRARWAGGKDCGELLMSGHKGRDRFMKSIDVAI